MIKIFEITEADDATLDAVNRLLPQLSKSAKIINGSTLQKLTNSECTRLYVAKEGDTIFGMLSLVVFSIPTGTKAWIEDVVVDERARGKGVGKELMNHALNVAKELGAKSADLTSRPSREVANKLYQAIGFEGRETNVYRYKTS
ncbi:GNAT family N-acetyltransferase [Candidatus Seribacter sulfatis]|uniref:GNAT family N-acetyltransferase n=1 Tax=Candidatus Seribacter sulfatis TaxID=3381756 RepID=UPI00389AFF39